MNNTELIKKRFCRAWGENDFGNKEEIYLEKYFLSESEYRQVWEKQLFTIFRKPLKFPERVFNDSYQCISLPGGIIFTEEEFLGLQDCLDKTNDKWFLIIEEEFLIDNGKLMLRFPSDIKWKDLLNGGLLSLEVFERPIRNYFVFGERGLWGKYVGSDYEPPKDILGFKSQVAEVFNKYFLFSE